MLLGVCLILQIISPQGIRSQKMIFTLSTTGVLQGVGDKESSSLPMAQEIHRRELCCRYPFQHRLYEEWKNLHLTQHTAACL